MKEEIEMKEKFPENFLWGSSTNAQQFEGGYLEEGKGISISDVRTITTFGTEADFEGFKTASKHYQKYQEDIAYYGEMGFKSYRFTIAWTRIFPNGDEEKPNLKGLEFYNNILTELEKYNITPIVTLYAYDAPQHLVDKYHSWSSRECIDDYLKYVEVVVNEFKDRVKYWIPFNEQNHVAFDEEYMTGRKAESEQELFEIIHHFNLAYAKATKLIHKIDSQAKVGANIGNACYYPMTCDPCDVELADDLAFQIGYAYADIYYRKFYPKRFLQRFTAVDFEHAIQTGDMDVIASSEPDFQSLTYYFSIPVHHKKYQGNLRNCIKTANPYIMQTDWRWNIDPYGLKHLLDDYYHRYQLPILILENGLGYNDVVENGGINDDYRIEFLRNHIIQMKKSIVEGVDVIGYLTWSATDLYSTREGFKKRYGFVYVDKDNDYKRIPKKSFKWFAKVIASNGEVLMDVT